MSNKPESDHYGIGVRDSVQIFNSQESDEEKKIKLPVVINEKRKNRLTLKKMQMANNRSKDTDNYSIGPSEDNIKIEAKFDKASAENE